MEICTPAKYYSVGDPNARSQSLFLTVLAQFSHSFVRFSTVSAPPSVYPSVYSVPMLCNANTQDIPSLVNKRTRWKQYTVAPRKLTRGRDLIMRGIILRTPQYLSSIQCVFTQWTKPLGLFCDENNKSLLTKQNSNQLMRYILSYKRCRKISKELSYTVGLSKHVIWDIFREIRNSSYFQNEIFFVFLKSTPDIIYNYKSTFTNMTIVTKKVRT